MMESQRIDRTAWSLGEDAIRVERRERHEKFERWMREHGAAIARVAAAFERVPAARDDLIQDIALALWTAMPGFRGECSERTLVYRIAQNRALTHIERRRLRTARVEPLGDHDAADRRPSPEAHVAGEQLRERLLEAIRELPLGQRQVMVLLLEGLSHGEIAEVLGTTEGNVAVRASRGRKELRELMGGAR